MLKIHCAAIQPHLLANSKVLGMVRMGDVSVVEDALEPIRRLQISAHV